jgi:hypothetical protein
MLRLTISAGNLNIDKINYRLLNSCVLIWFAILSPASPPDRLLSVHYETAYLLVDFSSSSLYPDTKGCLSEFQYL